MSAYQKTNYSLTKSKFLQTFLIGRISASRTRAALGTRLPALALMEPASLQGERRWRKWWWRWWRWSRRQRWWWINDDNDDLNPQRLDWEEGVREAAREPLRWSVETGLQVVLCQSSLFSTRLEICRENANFYLWFLLLIAFILFHPSLSYFPAVPMERLLRRPAWELCSSKSLRDEINQVTMSEKKSFFSPGRVHFVCANKDKV